MVTGDKEPLIDPALLATLSEEDRKDALAAAEAAKRAEERAEKRALERAMKKREEQRLRERAAVEAQQQQMNNKLNVNHNITRKNGPLGDAPRVQFVSKKRRMEQQKQKEENDQAGEELRNKKNRNNGNNYHEQKLVEQMQQQQGHHNLSQFEVDAIKQNYLGKQVATDEEHREKEKQRRRKRSNKKSMFKFQWDDEEDTSNLDNKNGDDVLYSRMVSIGNNNKSRQRQGGGRRYNNRSTSRNDDEYLSTMDSIATKPISKMTSRDWRIYRENYDIVVKGGKAPPPLRTFRESSDPNLPQIHSTLLDAIENKLKFKEPSPIQKQAIPIGLQRRDLIGIAETGSGKTIAFGIPLCNYLLNLPDRILDRVADDGPLALVMAPTRELALQINEELEKLLSCQNYISSFPIVGGQPIQPQAMRLRRGVHIVVGTPGRINDCIDNTYLVLNQCCYIVLDEADRMVDMGFAPQMESILESMGGLLKSEDEHLTYQQEIEDLKNNNSELPRHRTTAMFSATMPPEVEQLVRKYCRHPAMVSIGDKDSGKNTRITQRIVFLSSPSQKENALREQILTPGRHNDKIIVFVNEKKHADGIGRMVERFGRRCVVLHGGKSQEQREDNLSIFRKNTGVVLVATDVAGRGLDIQDVTHVINYDLPTRSIDNYCHRIGRTGRAGKEGLATSFITDEDTGIMAPLKSYLQSTGMSIPDRLARHPAANTDGGIGDSHISM